MLEYAETISTEKGEIATEEKELARLFNDHYINIIENSCGTKPIVCKRSENWRQQKSKGSNF